LPDRRDGREVRKAGWLNRHVDNDGILGELIEMRYRLNEDGGGGGHTGEFTRANGLEDREERIRILADSKYLGPKYQYKVLNP
jgi:hypothetical protein